MSLGGLQSVVGPQPNGGTYLDTLFNKVSPSFLAGGRSRATLEGVRADKSVIAFSFDYEGESDVRIQADITDHFAENNQAIQDHVAIRPVKIRLIGMVAEVIATPKTILGALNSVQGLLTVVPAYLGKYTPGVVQTMSKAVSQAEAAVNQINNVLNKVSSATSAVLGLFSKGPAPTAQERAFGKLYAAMATAQIFALNTEFGRFENMVIESLLMEQPEETKGWSRIVIELKQMRFAETVTFNSPQFAVVLDQQKASPVDDGNTQGAPASASILDQAVFEGK